MKKEEYMVSTGMIFGLCSSLAFGVLDILLSSAARKADIFHTLILAQALSALMLFLFFDKNQLHLFVTT